MERITNKELIAKDSNAMKIYKVWTGIRKSCLYKSQNTYKYHGAKGIEMGDEWQSDFQTFYQWSLENGYQDGYRFIRKDEKSHFIPENCQWVSQEEYTKMKDIEMLEINGITKSLAMWARENQLTKSRIRTRMEQGLSGEELLKPLTKEETTRIGYLQRLIKEDKDAERLNGIWMAVKGRCYTKSDTGYRLYGAKGIGMCEEWKNSFLSFYHWAKENHYEDSLFLVRKNKLDDYHPDNCVWLTPQESSKMPNIRSYLTIEGISKPVEDWAREKSISKDTLRKRFKEGLTDSTIFRTPGIYITYKGKEIRLQELANQTGISYPTLKKRYQNGAEGEELLKPVGMYVTYQGEEIRLQDLAALTGVSYGTLRNRYLEGLRGDELVTKRKKHI